MHLSFFLIGVLLKVIILVTVLEIVLVTADSSLVNLSKTVVLYEEIDTSLMVTV